jgi:hypothetical protein
MTPVKTSLPLIMQGISSGGEFICTVPVRFHLLHQLHPSYTECWPHLHCDGLYQCVDLLLEFRTRGSSVRYARAHLSGAMRRQPPKLQRQLRQASTAVIGLWNGADVSVCESVGLCATGCSLATLTLGRSSLGTHYGPRRSPSWQSQRCYEHRGGEGGCCGGWRGGAQSSCWVCWVLPPAPAARPAGRVNVECMHAFDVASSCRGSCMEATGNSYMYHASAILSHMCMCMIMAAFYMYMYSCTAVLDLLVVHVQLYSCTY